MVKAIKKNVRSAMRKLKKMAKSGGRKAKAAALKLARLTKAAALKVARTVKKVVAPITRPFKAVGRAVKHAALTAAASGPVQSMLSLGRSVWARVKNTWQRVLKPFLQDVGMLFAFGGFVVGLTYAPFLTALITGTAGLLTLGLSKGVGWLEKSRSKLARAVHAGLETIAQIMRVIAYMGAGFMAVVGAAISIPFAFAALAEIVLRTTGVIETPSLLQQVTAQGRGFVAKTKYALVAAQSRKTVKPEKPARAAKPAKRKTDEECLAEAQEALIQEGNEASISLREVLKERREEAASVAPMFDAAGLDAVTAKVMKDAAHIRTTVLMSASKATQEPFLVARGTEELQGTALDVRPKCESCEQSLFSDQEICDYHCTACVQAAREEDALRFTGVSLKARRVVVRLTQAGIEASEEFAASKANPDVPTWLVTARWRDANGVEDKHEREWSLLDNGDVVGQVVYDHKARAYSAIALGETIGSDRAYGPMMKMVWDVVMDARNAVLNVKAAEEATKKEGAVTHLANLLGGLVAPSKLATKKA